MLQTVQQSGISKSKRITELIREKAATTWPQNVIELAGAWKDFTLLEKLREKMGRDVDRESM